MCVCGWGGGGVIAIMEIGKKFVNFCKCFLFIYSLKFKTVTCLKFKHKLQYWF